MPMTHMELKPRPSGSNAVPQSTATLHPPILIEHVWYISLHLGLKTKLSKAPVVLHQPIV